MREIWTETHRGKTDMWRWRAETGVMLPQTKEYKKLSATTRSWKEKRKHPLLEYSEKVWPCWHLILTSKFPNWKAIHVFCSKWPYLWYFVMAALTIQQGTKIPINTIHKEKSTVNQWNISQNTLLIGLSYTHLRPWKIECMKDKFTKV